MLSKIFVGWMLVCFGWDLLFGQVPRMPSQEPFTASDIFQAFLLCLVVLLGDLLIAKTVAKDTK